MVYMLLGSVEVIPRLQQFGPVLLNEAQDRGELLGAEPEAACQGDRC